VYALSFYTLFLAFILLSNKWERDRFTVVQKTENTKEEV